MSERIVQHSAVSERSERSERILKHSATPGAERGRS